jgi:hypothetical protein
LIDRMAPKSVYGGKQNISPTNSMLYGGRSSYKIL